MTNIPNKDLTPQEDSAKTLIGHLRIQLDDWMKDRQEIEDIWGRAEDNYAGVFEGRSSVSEGQTLKDEEGLDWRSDVFYPLTEQKVNTAFAQLHDTLFRGNRFPYAIKNSPLPDSALNEDLLAGGFDLEKRLNAMSKKIDDSLVESNAVKHGSKGVFSGVLLGTAAFITVENITRKRNKWTKTVDGFSKTVFEEISPGPREIDIKDLWPDPVSDGDIEDGFGVYHRTHLGRADLQKMLTQKDINGDPVYKKKAINELLKRDRKGEPQEDASTDTLDTDIQKNLSRPFKRFTYSGIVRKELLDKEVNSFTKDYGKNDFVEVLVEFIDKKIIKAIENPLPAQRRPFTIVPYTKRKNSPWGIGVAEKLFDAQVTINSLFRTYLDNKQLSGNVMFAIDQNSLEKDEDLDFYPGKVWRFKTGIDVRSAFRDILVPDITSGILDAIGQIILWGDQASGVPKILEGNPGVRESTAFAENQRIQAASKQLGLVLRNFDQGAWIPIVEALYDWYMEFDEDQDIKGEFKVIATGFTTFESKIVKSQQMESLLIMSQKYPMFQQFVKFREVLSDWAESNSIDGDKYFHPPEVAEQIREQQQEAETQAIEAQRLSELESLEAKTEIEANAKVIVDDAKAENRSALDKQKQDHEVNLELIQADADQELAVLEAKLNEEKPSEPNLALGEGQ